MIAGVRPAIYGDACGFRTWVDSAAPWCACSSSRVHATPGPAPFLTVRSGFVYVGTSDEGHWTPPDSLALPLQPFRFDGAISATLGVEYRPTLRLGIEALAILAPALFRLEVTDPAGRTAADGGDVGFYAAAAGVNDHATPLARVDVFVGGFAGWMIPRTVDVRLDPIGLSGSVTFGDRWVYGIRGGIDVRLAESTWAASFGLRMLELAYRRQPSAFGPGETLLHNRWYRGLASLSVELATRF